MHRCSLTSCEAQVVRCSGCADARPPLASVAGRCRLPGLRYLYRYRLINRPSSFPVGESTGIRVPSGVHLTWPAPIARSLQALAGLRETGADARPRGDRADSTLAFLTGDRNVLNPAVCITRTICDPAAFFLFRHCGCRRAVVATRPRAHCPSRRRPPRRRSPDGPKRCGAELVSRWPKRRDHGNQCCVRCSRWSSMRSCRRTSGRGVPGWCRGPCDANRIVLYGVKPT